MQEGGLFKSEGSILLWMTNDDAKMPVRVKTKVVVGAIDADLTSYKGVYGKLTSKENSIKHLSFPLKEGISLR
ncbi:MAG: DUF3108 domain-containing protein [Ignavibacteriales bacterium]|nr:DUF3108 domain-containing protein [Ignavibacteriales bacterium]